jgi:hypothetical protein
MQGESSEGQMRADFQKEGGRGDQDSVDTMLEFNSLQYNMWPDLTVCVDRTMKNSYFQTAEYTSDQKTGFCILNTGSDFIQGRTSYLVFDLEVEGLPEDADGNPTVVPLWGACGSAYNLIRRLTISDRAGNELERVRDVGRLVNLQIRHTQSSAFLHSVGSCFLNPAEIHKHHAITSAYGKTMQREVRISDLAGGATGWYYKKIGTHVADGTYAEPCLGYGLFNIDEVDPKRYNAENIVNIVQSTAGETKGWKVFPTDRVARNEPKDYSVSGRRWCLPLRFMSGLFDYDQLLPMQVTSGLRLEFEWEDVQHAFRFAHVRGEDKSTYDPEDPPVLIPATVDMDKIKFKIKNARIVTDSCKLTDSVLQELNSRSAQNGLEIVYRTFFTTVNSPSKGSQELNLESRKAVSRCFGAFAVFYRNYSNAIERYIRDHNETLPMNALEWQWRAGNLYFPNQMMKAQGTTSREKIKSMASETFMHVMRMFYKLKHTYEESHVNVTNYTNVINGPGPCHYKKNITEEAPALAVPGVQDNSRPAPDIEKIAAPQCNLYPLDLERSTVQDLSGLPLNNSRVLNFQWKQIPETDLLEDIGQSIPTGPEIAPDDHIANGPAGSDWTVKIWDNFGDTNHPSTGFANDSYDVNIYMQYLKIARVFIDNIQIEE